ncbi:MIP/aquaporin family protein [Allorhizocola rhizosphaerae]|uniref:MIP/aquaporin family protein n=1 Tax=Allorhizocola rhizosphaerae TaxID=1872709 RepID=UPI0013C34273|nr:aquaporin [Allorhizocola rhizosphaerae]
MGEAIGTALLVFFIVGAVITSPDTLVAAIAVFVTIPVLFWIFGGHFNPWITLASAIRGVLDWLGALAIIVAQLVGGVVGALLVWAVLGGDGVSRSLGVTRPAADLSGVQFAAPLIAEALGVFLLCCVVFGLADGPGLALGLGQGMALAAGTLAIAAVSAASLNFARSFGPEVVMLFAGEAVDWAGFGKLWVYAVSGILGAALAGLLFPLWRPAAARR